MSAPKNCERISRSVKFREIRSCTPRSWDSQAKLRMCKEQEFLYPVNTRMNLSLILTVIRTQRTSETALVFHHHLSLLHYLYSVASVLIWRPRCSDSSAGRQLGKAPQCITTINRQLERHQNWTAILRLYVEERWRDGRTDEAPRPHSCTRLLSMPLVQQRRRAVSTANSWFSFYLKRKKKLPLFSFSLKRGTSPTSLLVLSHIFPQKPSHTYREYTRSTLR